jgi:hypothetical protein
MEMSRYNAFMEMDSRQSLDMLRAAHGRAEKLVAELEKQIREVETNPPDLAPEKLEEGRQALDGALASARRMLQSLDEAMKIASVSSN